MKANKTLLSWAIFLLIGDIAFSVLLWQLDTQGVSSLDGTHNEAGSTYIIRSLLMTLLFILPLSSLVLSALIALVMNKQVRYDARLLKAFLITLIVFYSLIALSSVWQLVMM